MHSRISIAFAIILLLFHYVIGFNKAKYNRSSTWTWNNHVSLIIVNSSIKQFTPSFITIAQRIRAPSFPITTAVISPMADRFASQIVRYVKTLNTNE